MPFFRRLPPSARALRPRALLAAAIALALTACQQVPMLPGLKPYRMDIQQGNVLTPEMVAKLKPGMTRQQVRFVLGTPPITDAFHQDRWDYVYYVNKGGQVVEHRRLILLFDGDVLKRVAGDPMPVEGASKEGENGAQGGKTKTEAEEKGIFGRLLDGIGL
jgi:outer membrane protein assembly factor BamE